MSVTAYPLSWPTAWKRTAPQHRKRGDFSKTIAKPPPVQPAPGSFQRREPTTKRVSINDAVERLLDQLTRLGIEEREDVVISSNVKTRLDGLPYSGQSEPEDPGVAVYWRTGHGAKTQSMAIDIYDRVADNIAAVAITLAYIRGIERHGGAEILERVFLGFQSLPPPVNGGRPWSDVLGVDANCSRDAAEASYRIRAMEAHPDKGGDPNVMSELNEAIRQARQDLRA